MTIDVFSVQCEALDSIKLVGFKGTEVLNRPFEVDVFFTVPVGTDVKGAIGARATVTADRDDGRGAMAWHGVFAGIRLLHETAERALYRGALVPQLWLLQQYVRSFVHTKKKIDAFATDTLKDAGLTSKDFEFAIHTGAYPTEEFVCQYRESHLAFLHRWFEREGLYYYFEHPDNGTEKMVVVDEKGHHTPLFGKGLVRYVPAAGHDSSAGECFRELHADFKLLPASVLITDYNYANPSAPVGGENAVSDMGRGQIREYGYRVFTEGEAKRLAQVKAQSIGCRELVITATGSYLGLRAGYTFEIEDAPGDLPAKCLAIEVRHAGAVSGASPLVMRYTGLDAKETYRVDVVAIPANVQYRAPQHTAWPRIYGLENGTVDGPAESQYAQIDDQGRYLVRMKFDASGLPDGSTSTYLRMMQPHGGTTEGWHFPLRKGTEVMVSFQGGDPDRPVIAGVVPNAVQPSNVTSKNYTQNVLRTGSGNFMVMDDTVDAEYIDMGTPGGRTRFYMGEPEHDPNFIGPPEEGPWPPTTAVLAPADPDTPGKEVPMAFSYYMKTDQGAGFDVGGNWWQRVGGGLSTEVTNEARIKYGGDHAFIVVGHTDEFFITGLTQKVQSGYKQFISGDGEQHVISNWTHQVTGKNHGQYGSWLVEVGGEVKVTSGAGYKLLVDGPVNVIASGAVDIASTAGTLSLSSPTAIVQQAPSLTSQAPDFVQMFSTQHSAGIEKFDAAAIAIAITSGLKLEYTGASVALTAAKVERVGCRAVNDGVQMSGIPLAIATGAIRVFSCGFVKL
ncbi:MAG: type VI secretion system tip protein VgrG [Polyangiaceae bacterium]|nr:type VI secretion system tip protein VgrG [Polyangiaceae bacterium]